jgi:hypothetical protein
VPLAKIEEKKGDKTENVSNPGYDDWLALDQQLLSFILNLVNNCKLARTKTTIEAWATIEGQFVAQRARSGTTRMALTNTKRTLFLHDRVHCHDAKPW